MGYITVNLTNKTGKEGTFRIMAKRYSMFRPWSLAEERALKVDEEWKLKFPVMRGFHSVAVGTGMPFAKQVAEKKVYIGKFILTEQTLNFKITSVPP